jgi:hypothetical protein
MPAASAKRLQREQESRGDIFLGYGRERDVAAIRKNMVPEAGVEPARGLPLGILSLISSIPCHPFNLLSILEKTCNIKGLRTRRRVRWGHVEMI